MRKNTKWTLWALAVFLWAVPAAAEPYTGGLTSDDGGLTGLGSWADPGSTLTWTVSFDDQTDLWHYEYTLCVAGGDNEEDSLGAAGDDDDDDDDDDGTCKAISHVVVEASTSFTEADLLNANPGNAEVGDHGTGNGNPDIPSTIHGIKFGADGGESGDTVSSADDDDDDDDGGCDCFTVSFDTARSPVWGDFYAKDGAEDAPGGDSIGTLTFGGGGGDKLTVQLWNAGLTETDTDPDDPASNGSVDGLHLLVPDTVEEPPGDGSLTIVKFRDDSEDGDPQLGEPPLAGWEFQVVGDGVDETVTTGADGTVTVDLPEGEYEITEINLPAGWTVTSDNPLTGVLIVEGQGTTVFFGNIPEPATLATLLLGGATMLLRRRRVGLV